MGGMLCCGYRRATTCIKSCAQGRIAHPDVSMAGVGISELHGTGTSTCKQGCRCAATDKQVLQEEGHHSSVLKPECKSSHGNTGTMTILEIQSNLRTRQKLQANCGQYSS
eukprot:jgi/Chrzof1/14540/Cz09g06180.t1